MPGHKRNKDFGLIGSDIDITEIDGFDDLHNPTGIIKELQDDISKLFGSKKSIISVNGSTCAILSAVSAVCNKGDEIIIARNCHKSVYNACFINELDVHYIEPDFDNEFGVYTKISQESIDELTKKYPNAKAVVITSPTYEGIVSEIVSPIPLIIDAAHGAHFGFADYLPKRANGDIVIQSLHKTLPSLTQTAVIHINNSKYEFAVQKYMNIFESSSPSYILLNSIDKCIEFLKESKHKFYEYKNILNRFYDQVKQLDNISVLKNDDITRIVLSAKGYSGTELAEFLRNHQIEAEGATLNYVILISTVCDTAEGFEKLIKALQHLETERDEKKKFINKVSLPAKFCKSSDVKISTPTPLSECENKVSAGEVFAYPPGIPIIAAGEIINKDILEYISLCISSGVNIISSDHLLPDSLLTKAQQ